MSSAAQARAVATNAARGRDLVAVDTDNLVHPTVSPPNDPGVSSQWALNPTKTSFLSAWNTTMGGGITVAVVDTGVAAGHPDLAGKVLPGHEFLGGIDRDLSPMIDDCGHGTHVAGTIAAIPNNRIGIAGAAPHVRILPVRVLSAANSCGGWSSDVAKGIVWAANHGARVINLSLGGPGPDSALLQAVSYARSHGAVVVAAAGNNHGECTPYKNKTIYPGATTGAIGVAAVDSNFQHACFSNTGSYVDLAAPGVGILSTVIAAGNPYSYGYASWNGTSMATPACRGSRRAVARLSPGLHAGAGGEPPRDDCRTASAQLDRRHAAVRQRARRPGQGDRRSEGTSTRDVLTATRGRSPRARRGVRRATREATRRRGRRSLTRPGRAPAGHAAR